MKTLSRILVLGGIFAALAGCGDPAPSTPIAPDLPAASASSANSAPASDLATMKAQEHAQDGRQ